jgi:hypothetical protein
MAGPPLVDQALEEAEQHLPSCPRKSAPQRRLPWRQGDQRSHLPFGKEGPVRIARHTRHLTAPEKDLAKSVFADTLPGWWRINISDGLGYDDRPYTYDSGIGFNYYTIHIGPGAYPDLTSTVRDTNAGIICNCFIHEMTHVWQYYHGYFVKLSSLAAQACHGSAAYSYTSGGDWDSYNVEQQADIVEDWFNNGMKTSDPLYRYIRDNIRKP